MLRSRLTLLLSLTVLLGASSLVPLGGQAAADARERYADDLFYNYYVPPCASSGTGAQLYPAPRPTPPFVGHTWITYQPLLPHEFLYQHSRTYFRAHPSGVTRTLVIWQ